MNGIDSMTQNGIGFAKRGRDRQFANSVPITTILGKTVGGGFQREFQNRMF
jgi:hypothetical protein